MWGLPGGSRRWEQVTPPQAADASTVSLGSVSRFAGPLPGGPAVLTQSVAAARGDTPRGARS